MAKRGTGNVISQLIFDSRRDPLPAGIRSAGRSTRQALFRAGDLFIDLSLGRASGTPDITLVGRVVDAKRVSEPMVGISIAVFHGDAVLAEAVGKRFGEFQLTYKHQGEPTLVAEVEGADSLEVPLRRLASERGVKTSRFQAANMTRSSEVYRRLLLAEQPRRPGTSTPVTLRAATEGISS